MTAPTPVKVNPVPFAFAAAKAGMSGRAGLAAARGAGIAIRDSTWFQIYGQVRTSLALQVVEPALPIARAPLTREIAQMQTKTATGFMQYVDVYVKDIDTGIVSTRPFAVRGQALVTRQKALETALNRFATATTSEGNYPRESVVGAAYTATYELVPTEQ